MQSIEVTGENVEEAIAKGVEELGVSPGDVIIEVLEEPSRGMFGLGARLARVRLQVIGGRAPAAVESPATVGDVDLDIDLPGGESTEDDAIVAKVVLSELLEKMGVTATIDIERLSPTHPEEDAPWQLNVTGSDLGILIGRRGETLSALQYITRLISSRRLQRRANIVVDVSGYKSRRSDQLQNLAERMAQQAVDQGRTVTLEPMPPNERRIIHMALRDHDAVITKSVGEGESRKVTIVPK